MIGGMSKGSYQKEISPKAAHFFSLDIQSEILSL